MNKHILSTKKLKKKLLLTNESIEAYFAKLKFLVKDIKNLKFSPYNSFLLGIGVFAFLTLIYFLIPTFYKKNIIQSDIKNQIMKKYNVDVKFNQKIKYRLLPKPHYLAENLSVLKNQREIAITKNFRIYLAISKFFSINKVEIKDLVFKETDFNIGYDDFSFFLKLLDTEPNANKIIIKDGNIFFKNMDEDVLFINKIKDSKFYYDSNNLVNIISSRNEVFNVPFKFHVKKDKFNKKIFTEFNSKKIRLNIENEFNYDKEVKSGLIEVLFVNKSTSFKYQIKKNSLDFISKDNKNKYEGVIDFKPFYLNSTFNYDGLSSKNLFNDDSILIDIIKSKIFNNKNLNSDINIIVKDITNIDELNNLFLRIKLDEGRIGFSNSSVMWRDNLKIILKDSQLNNENDEVNLTGKIIFEFNELDNFYRSFQIQKVYRKDIKEIQIDFVFNFDNKKIFFDNVRVDNSQNLELEKYVNDFNNNKNRIFNKITFKNFVNNFFAAYAG